MAELVGVLATQRVAASDKFRATWNVVTLFGVPIGDSADKQAVRIRELLPSLGVTAVSNPSALSTDRVIVFDIRLHASWGGKTAGEIVSKLNSIVSLNPGFTIVSVTLMRLEALSLALSSGELVAGQAGATTQGNKESEEKDLWERFQAFLKGLAGNVAKGVGVVVGIAVIGGVTYWYITKRRR